MEHPAWWLFVAGCGGFGLGIGLVLGAFVARTLRHYMRDEGLRPYGDDPEEGSDDEPSHRAEP